MAYEEVNPEEFVTFSEFRKEDRRNTELPAGLLAGEHYEKILVTDISETGAKLLINDYQAAAGDELTVLFRLDEYADPAPFKAEVMWSKKSENPNYDSTSEVGVKWGAEVKLDYRWLWFLRFPFRVSLN